MNRSNTLRWTRIRDRAQQSCPALSNTAYGAVAAARSRSASANTILALLPPSSSVTRFTWRAQSAISLLPTSVDPVKTILRTSSWSTSRWPTTEPLPGSTWKTPSGRPASRASSPIRIAVSGVRSAGLAITGLPGGQGGRQPPAQDRHGEVPRHDQPDDADRLLERDVEAARHRDLLAGQPLRGGRVVAQHVADVARLPAGLADRVARAGHLQLGEFLEVARPPPRRSGAAAWPGRPGVTARQAACAAAARAMASSACSAEHDGTAATVSSVAGFTTVNVDMPAPASSLAWPCLARGSGPATSARSRGCSSQSVTAASNAAISTRAALA